MKSISSSSYQKHRLYPTIVRAVAGILATDNVVTPIGVLLRLQRITKQQHDDWRFGGYRISNESVSAISPNSASSCGSSTTTRERLA